MTTATVDTEPTIKKATIVVAWLLLALNLADLITTYMFLSGVSVEGNPVGSALLANHSMPLVKIAVPAALIWFATYRQDVSARRAVIRFGLYSAVAGFYALIVALNIGAVLAT